LASNNTFAQSLTILFISMSIYTNQCLHFVHVFSCNRMFFLPTSLHDSIRLYTCLFVNTIKENILKRSSYYLTWMLLNNVTKIRRLEIILKGSS
jgi:hypothetical protein